MNIYKGLKANITKLSDTRVAVEITFLNEVSLGVLYYEKPKSGWTNKPIMPTKWRCVDAKVEGVYQQRGDSVTPLELMKWAQKLVDKELHAGGEEDSNNEEADNENGEDGIPSFKGELNSIPTETDEHNKSNDND